MEVSRPNNSGDIRTTLVPQSGGRLTATNITAAALVRFAYDLPDFQIVGGPAWLNTDRFDVVAKAEGDPPLAQKRIMLRGLLADRFKLVAYDIPRGNIAAYYPETNPLVPLSSTAIVAGTPTSKSIPVILTPHEAAGSTQQADTTFAGA